MSSPPKVEDAGARASAFSGLPVLPVLSVLVLSVLVDNVECRLDGDADASATRAGGMTVEAISSVVPSPSAVGCDFLGNQCDQYNLGCSFLVRSCRPGAPSLVSFLYLLSL